MRYPNLVPAAALCALISLLAPTAARGATTTPAERCAAVKLDAAARAVTAHVACHARAIEKGTSERAGCHASADKRLDAAFSRIEARGGCAFTGDESTVDGDIDAIVDALVAGATTGRCGAIKLRAAARAAFSALACHRVGARKGVDPNPACLAQADARLLAAFARVEKHLACGTTGDATAVQTLVDAFVTETSAQVLGGSDAVDPAPKNLQALIAGNEVQLQWTAPAADSGKTHVRVLRELNADPVDAADPSATVVFFGTATSASHPLADLLPDTTTTARTYHYAAFGCTAGGDCESTGSRTTLAPSLLQVLEAGGYTIYFRHASATLCVDQTNLGTAATTSSPDWWKSCDANCGTATARQLDATGTTQATTIGQGFDTVAIPVGRVIASEFCRTRTTAELMDLGPTVETNQGITFFVYDEAGRCAAAQALLAEAPVAGTNTAIIGHAGFPAACDVLSQLGMGEGAIFKPDGAGGSTFVARVLPDGWAVLE